MPVLSPEPIDEVYINVVARSAAGRGGFAGLALAAHVAYRETAMESYKESFRRRMREELVAANFSVESLAVELGNYKGGTLRLYLKGERDIGLDLLFALESWLRSLGDEYPFSPFSKGMLEAARAEGYCGSVRAVREKMAGEKAPALPQRDFWQLHRMYTLRGWQGTAPANPARFAGDAGLVSGQAACEYTETFLDFERAGPPRDIDQPYELAELRKLDDHWGIYYLITRMCLACGADDQHVVGFPPPEGEDD